MGQRNIPCTDQMLDLKSQQSITYLRPDYSIPPVFIAIYPNQDTYAISRSTSGNAADPNLYQFADNHGRNVMYGSQLNTIQYCHHVPNFDLGGPAPYNLYRPCMLPTLSGNFSVPVNNQSVNQLPPSNHTSMESTMDSYGISDSPRGSSKRKNAEVVTGNYCNANGSLNSVSSSGSISFSSEHLQQEANEANLNLTPSQYQVAGIIPTPDTLQRSVRGRSNPVSLQPEPEFSQHYNYVFQQNYMGQSFQPSPNGCMGPLPNYYGHGDCYNGNYTGAVSYMHGLHMGPAGTASIHVQDHQEASSNGNCAFNLHPSSFSDHHHLPPVQSMQDHCYNRHPQIPAPSYWHQVNYLQSNNVYPYANDTDFHSRLTRPFPSVAAPAHISWSEPESTQEVSHRSSRILLPEDAATQDISEFYGLFDANDQHGDMRMDIDDMSYEELLALEEHIGDVNTGLSEDFILKNLKTSVYVPQLTFSLSDCSSQSAIETCAICLEEFEENERLGLTNCSHRYHADCIKRWLLIKNQCPTCKTSALTTDRGQ